MKESRGGDNRHLLRAVNVYLKSCERHYQALERYEQECQRHCRETEKYLKVIGRRNKAGTEAD